MQKAMNIGREKYKWLTAMCLCLLCFFLCIGMLARPTHAATLHALKDIERIESTQWGPASPGSNKDSLGELQANSYIVGGYFDKAGVVGSARYKLEKRYAELSGTLACAEAGTSLADMRLKVYADDKAEPIFTSVPILRTTKPFAFKVDVRGVSVLKLELVQAEYKDGDGTPAAFALLVNPAFEAVSAPPAVSQAPLKDVPLLASAWEIAYGSNKDSLGNAQEASAKLGGAFEQTGAGGSMGYALYQLDKKYVKLSGKLACAGEGDEDAAMLVKFYADGSSTPFYTSPTIKKDTQPIDFSVSFSNATVLKIELVDSKGAQRPVKGWVLLINPLLEPLPPPEPTTTTTVTTTVHRRYEPVIGWKNLYLLLEWQEAPPAQTTQHAAIFNNPALNYVFSFSGKPETDKTQVYVKDSKFYFELLKNNVFAALLQDGMYDINAAVWAGPDKIFGSPDDRALVLREGSLFYEESAGVWKFVVSRFDYLDSRWSAVAAPTTTAAPTTAPTTSTVTGSAISTSTTINGFLTKPATEGPPKTGVPYNAGLLVCVAALFMGCVYCGYRVLKKERA